eukprot:COSAG02_NODE_2406_length_8930_cov_10.414676_7_plen_204_part_00
MGVGRINSTLQATRLGWGGHNYLGRCAPVALETLAHDARVLPQVTRLRCHDRFGLAELTDLAVQPLPAILFQEVFRDLRPRTRDHTPDRAASFERSGRTHLIYDGPSDRASPVVRAPVAPQTRVFRGAVPRLAHRRKRRRAPDRQLLHDAHEHLTWQRVDVVLVVLEVGGVAALLLHLRPQRQHRRHPPSLFPSLCLCGALRR